MTVIVPCLFPPHMATTKVIPTAEEVSGPTIITGMKIVAAGAGEELETGDEFIYIFFYSLST